MTVAIARAARWTARPAAAQSLGGLIVGRLIQALIVALVVGVVGFAMLESLPGDAAYRIAAGRYGHDMVSAAAAEQVRAELGLDRPSWVRLLAWLGRLLTLDLGYTAVTGERVIDAVAHQLGHSVLLAVVAVWLALLIATPIGVIAGLNPGGLFDRVTAIVSILLRATPAFLLGVVLILLIAVQMRAAPAAGHSHGANAFLPALTLGLVLASVLTRVIRNAVARTVASEAFQFARHKGLSTGAALWRHGFRNAAAPVVAYLGVQTALLLEGVVVVESVFAWPGIGHALTHAVFERDVTMLQGTALALGLSFVLLSFLIDLACRAIDPRMRA
ncbi:ABC transporter permease [Rubrimonas sp.]|uniref:ABC transporter permease n=1 Tax=Rubrimonas sp. TaxID=2036015 RepID=UPI002FDEABD0